MALMLASAFVSPPVDAGEGAPATVRAGGDAGCPSVTRIRFHPRDGQAKRMQRGRFAGSNGGPTTDFETIAELKGAPPDGQWSEIRLAKPVRFRFVKYESPLNGWGNVAEVELWSGDRKIAGTQTAYVTSKFAVRGFTESLRHELEASTVRVSVVHPGGIRTQIAARARFDPAKISREEHERAVRRFERLTPTTPEQAGDVIINGVLADAPRILIGRDARAIAWLQRLFPVTYWRLVRRQFAAVT
jgi:NAD(P)-dependent dehydrogenase (short-subunit alcohol dehydrogenase family)